MLWVRTICNSIEPRSFCKGHLVMKSRLGFLLLLFTCGLASAQTADCNALTRQALDLSGFNQSLDHIADVLFSDASMQQIRGRESGEEFLSIFKPIMLRE